jgi:hypothetical protein
MIAMFMLLIRSGRQPAGQRCARAVSAAQGLCLHLLQVSVNRSMPPSVSGAKSGPSGSAYVTFRRPQDAQQCIETIDGATWRGAQAGTDRPAVMDVLRCRALQLRRVALALPDCQGCSRCITCKTYRSDGARLFWHDEVLQCVSQGRALQQHGLPVSTRRG